MIKLYAIVIVIWLVFRFPNKLKPNQSGLYQRDIAKNKTITLNTLKQTPIEYLFVKNAINNNCLLEWRFKPP